MSVNKVILIGRLAFMDWSRGLAIIHESKPNPAKTASPAKGGFDNFDDDPIPEMSNQ